MNQAKYKKFEQFLLATMKLREYLAPTYEELEEAAKLTPVRPFHGLLDLNQMYEMIQDEAQWYPIALVIMHRCSFDFSLVSGGEPLRRVRWEPAKKELRDIVSSYEYQRREHERDRSKEA